MRALGLFLSAALALSVAACGNDQPDIPAAADRPTTTAPQADNGTEPGDSGVDAAASAQADAEEIAVRLEQIFAASSYPKDLAGAIKVAQANGLEPSQGNTIGGYTYDPNEVEFKLCVENSSGAYAIYDTRPMSMRGAGERGGCP